MNMTQRFIKSKSIWTMLILFLMTSLSFAQIDENPKKKANSEPALQYQSEEILVKLKKNMPGTAAQQAINALGAKSAKKFTLMKGANNHDLQRWWKLKIPKGVDVDKFIEKISKNPNVEIAEPNYLVTTLQTPNDQHFDLLWGMHNALNDADIDAPEAWDKHTGSDSIIVAEIGRAHV